MAIFLVFLATWKMISCENDLDFKHRHILQVCIPFFRSTDVEGHLMRETLLLIRAVQESNRPKLLAQDAALFDQILNDIFPGVSAIGQEQGCMEVGK